MTAFPERQTTMAAGWSRRTAAFSAVLLITVWTGHHFGLVETPAYLWVLALVALLAAFALLFAGWAFARLWNFGDQGGRDLTAGALIALVVLAPYAVASWWALTFPPLSDISTDPAGAGLSAGQWPPLRSAFFRSRCHGPERVAQTGMEKFHHARSRKRGSAGIADYRRRHELRSGVAGRCGYPRCG
jgi:cation transport ATPase